MKKERRNIFSVRLTTLTYFIVLTLTIGVSYILTFLTFQSLEKYEVIIKAALENSERKDKILVYANKVYRNDWAQQKRIDANIRLYKIYLEIFKNGGSIPFEENNIKIPPCDPKILGNFENLEKTWKQFEKQARFISSYSKDFHTVQDLENALKNLEKKAEELSFFSKNFTDAYLGISRTNTNLANIRLLIILITNIGLIIFGFFLIRRLILAPLKIIADTAEKIGKGDLNQKVEYQRNNEIGYVAQALNGMLNRIQNATKFIKSIEEGELSTSYTANGQENIEKDTLASALIQMQRRMQNVALEESDRTWANEGIAKFGDILRDYSYDTQVLGFEIISNLVEYLEAHQGGIFVLNDENEKDKYIELIAAYAFGKSKFKQKNIKKGEGIVGQVYKDGDVVYITDIPENYVDISSGLGNAKPKSILVVPLKINEVVHGVIELASFRDFKKYQIEFVERVSENIASTIYSVKSSESTKKLLANANDITAQMKQQEAEMLASLEELENAQVEMRKNEEALSAQSLAINSSLITVELDIEQNILAANDLFLRATGYELADIQGKSYMRVIPSDKEELDKYLIMWDNIKAGIPQSGVYKRLTRDGREVWLRATYSPIRNKEGKVYRAIKLGFDISQERKQRLIYEEQIDAFRKSAIFAEYDLTGIFREMNDSFLYIFGYQREELLGEYHSVLMQEEDSKESAYQLMWQRLAEGETYSGEFKRKNKNGNEIWVQGNFTPVFDTDGKPYKILEFIIDITKQKNDFTELLEAQQKYQTQEKELRRLLDNTQDAIFAINPDFRVTMLNEGTKRFYELLGIGIDIDYNILKTVPNEDNSIWKYYFNRAFEGEKFDFEREIVNQKTKREFFINVHLNPILDIEQNVISVAIFLRNITQKREQEVKLAERAKEEIQDLEKVIEKQKNTLEELESTFEQEKIAITNQIAREKDTFKLQQKLYEKSNQVIILLDNTYDVQFYGSYAKETFLRWHLYLQPSYFLPDIFLPNEKYVQWEKHLNEVWENQKVRGFEEYFVNKYEKTIAAFWIEIQALTDEAGISQQLLITAKDTSKISLEKRKLLKGILRRQATSPQIVEDQLKLMFVFDQEYRFIFLSDFAKSIYEEWDYSLQIGYFLLDTFPVKKFYEWKVYCDKALEGKEITLEENFVNRKTKSIQRFSICFKPLVNGSHKVLGVTTFVKQLPYQSKRLRNEE